MRAGRTDSQLAAAAALMLVLSKSLDGLDRKLAGFGIALPADLGQMSGRIEEMLELGVAIMLMQALVCFLRDRCVNRAPVRYRAAPTVPAPCARSR